MRIGAIIIILILVIVVVAILVYRYIRKGRSKWTAAIIEPREHEDLEYVIDQFRSKLDSDIKIVVFYGKGRKPFVESITKGIKNLQLVELDKDNYTAKDYNDFVKSSNFWKYITTEKLLIFQTDSMLCSNSDYKLEDFEKYDFIGSRTPWDFKLPGGNGGLSVRDVIKSKKCISEYENGKLDHLKKYGEDGFFARCFDASADHVLPTDDEKDMFSSQNYFTKKSFGGHQVSVQLSDDDREEFYSYCPEYKRNMR